MKESFCAQVSTGFKGLLWSVACDMPLSVSAVDSPPTLNLSTIFCKKKKVWGQVMALTRSLNGTVHTPFYFIWLLLQSLPCPHKCRQRLCGQWLGGGLQVIEGATSVEVRQCIILVWDLCRPLYSMWREWWWGGGSGCVSTPTSWGEHCH